MPIYTYACINNHRQESFRSISDRDFNEVCTSCGKKSKRVLQAPSIKLEPFSGDFPSASDHWEQTHKEKLQWELKHERDKDEPTIPTIG